MEEEIWYCKLCSTKALYAPGIGEFCPNKECNNLDGEWGKELFTKEKIKWE